MIDFTIYADEYGDIQNPCAAKVKETWIVGTTSANYLNTNYGQYETLDECISNTESEGLQLFFEHLKAQQ